MPYRQAKRWSQALSYCVNRGTAVRSLEQSDDLHSKSLAACLVGKEGKPVTTLEFTLLVGALATINTVMTMITNRQPNLPTAPFKNT